MTGAATASFVYDGDGKQVKSVMDGVTTYFVGNHYEVTNGVVTKYYFAGGQRIAMRKNGTLSFLLSDHLSSTSITTDANGNRVSETRYKAWGEVRFTSGVVPTKYSFTGQYSNVQDFGLLFYNARWMDPQLGRFAQADSIVPGGVQGLDRYAYVGNNPVRYTDPSGYKLCAGEFADDCMPSHGSYGVSFQGGFTQEQKDTVMESVEGVAYAIWASSDYDTPWEAFRSVYHNGMTFVYVDAVCEIDGSTCWGYTPNDHTIYLYARYWAKTPDGQIALPSPITAELIVHELGHAFNQLSSRVPQKYINSFGGLLSRSFEPFAPGYHFGQDESPSEIFADMFVGWVYGNLGPTRSNVMTTNMVDWIQ